jgi:hypothetical protein
MKVEKGAQQMGQKMEMDGRSEAMNESTYGVKRSWHCVFLQDDVDGQDVEGKSLLLSETSE